MPNFEVFTRRSTPVVTQASMSIQTRGNFSLNRAAYEALGKPPAVELMYDRGEQVIGLRPVDPKLTHAYPIRRQQNSDSYIMAGIAFCRFYGIPFGEVTRRYNVEMDGDTLIVDLKQTPIEVNRREVSVES